LKYKRIALAAAAAAVVVGGTAAAMGIASAGTTNAPAHPSIVTDDSLGAGDTTTFTIAGRTFGSTTVPSNATGVTLSVSVDDPASSGRLTVYPTGSTRPSTATLNFSRHNDAATTADVDLGTNGRISVYSTRQVDFSLRLLSYTTPDISTLPGGGGRGDRNCDSTIQTIAPSSKTLTNVGGSIRTRATDFGSVTLPAGTYDTRVIGGFTGANNNDTWYTSNIFLTGTLVVVKGATIASDFSNDVTDGGVIIPKSNSTTLTQDPTLAISTFLVLTHSTDVHVQLFAYASDSSSTGSGLLKGNIQSAQFRRVC
jgi:hypothetical protein